MAHLQGVNPQQRGRLGSLGLVRQGLHSKPMPLSCCFIVLKMK